MEEKIKAEFTATVWKDRDPAYILVKNEVWAEALSKFRAGSRVKVTITEDDGEPEDVAASKFYGML